MSTDRVREVLTAKPDPMTIIDQVNALEEAADVMQRQAAMHVTRGSYRKAAFMLRLTSDIFTAIEGIEGEAA